MGGVFNIKNKINGYEKLRSEILSVDNGMYDTNISESRYQQLIEEACNRSTVFRRRMEIRDELRAIRKTRRNEVNANDIR